MTWSGFGNLDLSGVQEAGPPMLQPGVHIVRTKDVKIEDIQGTANKKLVVTFVSEDGTGQLIDSLNIHHSSPMAQEIGLRQLKSMLVYGGHPNPDQPGDISTLNNLRVGILVDMGKPWRDRNGNTRTTPEIKRFYDPAKPISFTPNQRVGGGAAAGGPSYGYQAPQQPGSIQSNPIDDDIPF